MDNKSKVFVEGIGVLSYAMNVEKRLEIHERIEKLGFPMGMLTEKRKQNGNSDFHYLFQMHKGELQYRATSIYSLIKYPKTYEEMMYMIKKVELGSFEKQLSNLVL